MHAPAPSPALRQVATVFLRRRPWIVAPMFAAVLVTLAAAGAPPRQLAALAIVAGAALTFFGLEARRGRRQVISATGLLVSLLVTLGGITLASAATGAGLSPILFMAFAPTVVGFAAFGRSRQSDALFAAAVAAIALLAALPPDAIFPRLDEGVRRVLVLACAADALLLLRLGVGALTDAHAAATRAAAGAGEDVVASATARTAALEAMGARVAHEVKNPLSAIRALVEVLAECAREPRDAQRLAVVLGEVDRIDEILRGYLAMARPLDALAPRPTDTRAVLAEAAAVIEARAERAGIALVVDAPAIPVELDARRIKEALLNLLLNAIDATPPGGRIRLAAAATAGGVALTVEDSGAGMDAARLATAATPFATGREGGTGLGLALARQAAEQHGGALALDSAGPGRGTVARLTLPLRAAEPA